MRPDGAFLPYREHRQTNVPSTGPSAILFVVASTLLVWVCLFSAELKTRAGDPERLAEPCRVARDPHCQAPSTEADGPA